ncbi:GNAT family N-acetyltransferase [Paeniglutamicibacter psychrophenolicus]|uniref:GNAT family N-acetyltransferase n=1 Tax=Paeniglutamicibacter psychrophenolicus TaxID=257454 RepID=UPI0027829700|nr:GNAT family N-acetyltransferase [Paeniglutamicibacter psychrophenolicus]MDQ0094601.1 ribosomal protein S18 acetylase RimI-like enzyme [Paeniglutamicibacter psychrophenolicus]
MEPAATQNPNPENVGLVRRAVEQDAAALAEALVQAWRAAYAGIIDAAFLKSMDVQQIAGRWAISLGRDTGEKPLVAVLDGEVVGFCQFGVPRDASAQGTGELYALNLLPACWGRGLGTLLLLETTAALRRLGYATAYLWVAEGNRRAMDLYGRHGWHDTGTTKEDARFTPALLERRYAIELA